jgi:hypothetical protein
MKYVSFLAAPLLLAVCIIPSTAAALSCLDPASSIEYHATDPDYTIVTAKAGEVIEYVQTKAASDQSFMQDSGYTGQYINVKESHRGGMDSQAFVYFRKDATWGYMCTSNPPAVGEESIYVLSKEHGTFGLTHVVQVYALDSVHATDLLAALETEGAKGQVYTKDAATWQQDLAEDLREMVFFIRLKLNEWRFWMAR